MREFHIIVVLEAGGGGGGDGDGEGDGDGDGYGDEDEDVNGDGSGGVALGTSGCGRVDDDVGGAPLEGGGCGCGAASGARNAMLKRFDSVVVSGVSLMLCACINWLKLVSFVHTNYDMRSVTNSTNKAEAKEKSASTSKSSSEVHEDEEELASSQIVTCAR
ncbi:Membrane bound O-acyl transferase, MBOAT [Artemisia annua]|uniref:Membrane bound O-acyl transferase, MBOAT n=1 Tax=Artemisia annua TaxID=35608 RepID=A0A2U1P463_ARTAN|nr:Membrane bound O-acyl transferase, MBOAT [Artemisia annua]